MKKDKEFLDNELAEKLKRYGIKARTAAELRRILPKEFRVYKCVGWPKQWECSNIHSEWHCDPEKDICREAAHDSSRVNVIARMIIYLLVNRLSNLSQSGMISLIKNKGR